MVPSALHKAPCRGGKREEVERVKDQLLSVRRGPLARTGAIASLRRERAGSIGSVGECVQSCRKLPSNPVEFLPLRETGIKGRHVILVAGSWLNLTVTTGD